LDELEDLVGTLSVHRSDTKLGDYVIYNVLDTVIKLKKGIKNGAIENINEPVDI
jgi:hypothetical protein